MVQYSFEPWKAPIVRDGTCTQTIRARRYRTSKDGIRTPVDPKVGDRLQLFAGGYKAGGREKLQAVDPVVLDVQPITISFLAGGFQVTLNGSRLSRSDIADLSKQDGFKGYKDFKAYFEKACNGTTLDGLVIRWVNVESFRPSRPRKIPFRRKFCDRCIYNHGKAACHILAWSDKGEIPYEWIKVCNKPECTKYRNTEVVLAEREARRIERSHQIYVDREEQGQLTIWQAPIHSESGAVGAMLSTPLDLNSWIEALGKDGISEAKALELYPQAPQKNLFVNQC